MAKLNKYFIEATEQLKDWNSYVKHIPMLNAGVKVLEKIENAGFKAFIVGGPIRDLILGMEINDKIRSLV